MAPPSIPPQPDPSQHALDNAEAELRRRLHEACTAEAKGISSESTQEIRQLEDTLLAAAVAARQTIKARRQMKPSPSREREQPITTKSDSAAEKSVDNPAMGKGNDDRPDTRVREFTDDSGRAWRAWQVIPGLTRASASGRSFLGDFQNGWICFEGVDSPARRRLPCRQSSWATVTDGELQSLLAQAIDAPGREGKS